MRSLRVSLSCIFLLTGITCASIVARFLRPALFRAGDWDVSYFLREMIVPVVFSVFAVIFFMACWTGFLEKTSARGWGIAASIVNLQSALFPVFLYFWFPHTGASILVMSVPLLVVVGLGVCGLAAYWRPLRPVDAEVKASESASVPGDCTLPWVNKIVVLLFFGLTYCSYTGWIRWAQGRDLWSGWGFVPDNVCFFAAIAVALIVHELGHAAAGLSVGMRLRLFAIGPFQWSRSNGKWKFEFQAKMMLQRGGVVGMVPVTVRSPHWHSAIIAVAGPAINFVTGAIALITASASDYDSVLQLGGRLGLFGVLSIALGIGNLIPFRLGQHYSDGARLLQHLSNNPFCEYLRVLQVVMAVSETPLRPRDYDLATIERALVAYPAGLEGHYLKLYTYDHYFDTGDIPDACRALEEAEAIYNASALSAPTEVSFILGHAGLRGDAAAARLWWERMEQRTCDRAVSDYWLAKCAFDCVEGRRDEANAALHKVDQIIAESQSTGSRAFDVEWSSRLRHAISQTA